MPLTFGFLYAYIINELTVLQHLQLAVRGCLQ